MSENSKIEWCDHTFNPWIGCTKVSPACDHCYAESWSKWAGRDVWGPHADRQRTKTQGDPIKWNKRLEGTGRRERVFVASLADVFDNHKSILSEWRIDMWDTIRKCQNLDFLLLTKRPQNIEKFLPYDWGDGYPNVWLGTTAENQVEAERRIPVLLDVQAKKRFLSVEPLLGSVDLSKWTTIPTEMDRYQDAFPSRYDKQCRRLDWIIVGGESGPGARAMHPDWARSIRDQCAEAGVPFHFKQWGEWNEKGVRVGKKAAGRLLDGRTWDQVPESAS